MKNSSHCILTFCTIVVQEVERYGKGHPYINSVIWKCGWMVLNFQSLFIVCAQG